MYTHNSTCKEFGIKEVSRLHKIGLPKSLMYSCQAFSKDLKSGIQNVLDGTCSNEQFIRQFKRLSTGCPDTHLIKTANSCLKCMLGHSGFTRKFGRLIWQCSFSLLGDSYYVVHTTQAFIKQVGKFSLSVLLLKYYS